jgi:DNA primase
MLSKDEIRARIDLVQLIGQTVKLKKDGANFKGLCPLHDDHTPSLVVYPDSQRWRCYGCNKSGDCFEWNMQTAHIDFPTALAQLRELCGDRSTERSTTNTTAWNITDVDGKVLAQHVRLDYSDGTKSYTWPVGTKPVDLPLYGLKHLFDMGTAAVTSIIICEGEKAADALMKAGWAGVGTVTGASSCPNEEAFHPLIGFEARTYLWADSDDIGRSHMDKVARHLKTLEMVPYLITWTDAPSHGDAYDFLQQGGDVKTLLDAAVAWTACVKPRAVEVESKIIPRSAGTARGCVSL